MSRKSLSPHECREFQKSDMFYYNSFFKALIGKKPRETDLLFQIIMIESDYSCTFD